MGRVLRSQCWKKNAKGVNPKVSQARELSLFAPLKKKKKATSTLIHLPLCLSEGFTLVVHTISAHKTS
jgi:hypothetical protein